MIAPRSRRQRRRVSLGLPLLLVLATYGISGTGAEKSRAGKEVYDIACAACHAAGVLQAPKSGVRQDWIEREKQGFDVMLEHAIKGFKNMPARGGNPTLENAEVENAVRYMLTRSGFEQYAPAAPPEEEGTAATAAKAPPAPAAKSVSNSVNQFNRLMRPPAEWNLPPISDGIHDPEHAATQMLQAPREAFESLTRSSTGNRVDWVKALENNEISPRYDRLDGEVKPVVMDLNIVREVKGSMPDVVYPHKQHTEWLDCSNCHPAIFIPQKGANQISMASILLGQKCGVCHGKVAFPVSECRRCHSKPKATTTSSRN